ncbi:hypothetical protein IW262DRAFT_1355544 [Armillaria fumosa]|nr:hypothetical protein IW262DRAFT_1355544 [Armillaria fumosa]
MSFLLGLMMKLFRLLSVCASLSHRNQFLFEFHCVYLVINSSSRLFENTSSHRNSHSQRGLCNWVHRYSLYLGLGVQVVACST